MRKIYGAAYALVLFAAAATSWAQAEQTRTIDRNIPVGSARTLRLVGHNGDMRIRATGTATVRLHAVISANDSATLRDSDVDVSRAGSQLEIRDRCAKKSSLFFKKTPSCGVTFTLEIPRALALAIENANGGVIVGGGGGSIAVKTSNGNVTVSDASSTLALTSSRGNVGVTLADGWRGDRIVLDTSLGNVTLAVPRNFRGRLDAKTTVGAVTNDTKLTSESPGPEIKLRSAVGSIRMSYR